MHKGFIKTAAWLGALAVALGAFGAHKLKELVSEQAVATFETGVKYQFFHVLALLFAGILFSSYPNKYILNAGRFFIAGILLFSGSLYVLTVKTGLVLSGLSWVGPITPLGGLCFIIGWVLLALGVKKA